MLRSWHIVICSESNKFSTQHVYKLSDVRNNNRATTWTQLARGKVKLKYNKWCLGNMTKWPLFQLCLSCFCSSYYYNLYRTMEVKIIADRVFIWWKIKASFDQAKTLGHWNPSIYISSFCLNFWPGWQGQEFVYQLNKFFSRIKNQFEINSCDRINAKEEKI